MMIADTFNRLYTNCEMFDYDTQCSCLLYFCRILSILLAIPREVTLSVNYSFSFVVGSGDLRTSRRWYSSGAQYTGPPHELRLASVSVSCSYIMTYDLMILND